MGFRDPLGEKPPFGKWGKGLADLGWAEWGPPRWPAASLGRLGHVGFSPTWLSQGRWSPSSTYIYGCPLALKITPILSLSLSLSRLSRDSTIGVVHGLRFSPPYAHRRAAGLLSSTSAARPWIGARRSSSPPYVCDSPRGTTLGVLGGARLHHHEDGVILIVASRSSRPRGRLRRLHHASSSKQIF